MNVTIELLNSTFFEIEFSLPLLGHHCYSWSDTTQTSYGVLNGTTGALIKKGFNTWSEAESWSLQENFCIV
jgi:hypothetical protein